MAGLARRQMSEGTLKFMYLGEAEDSDTSFHSETFGKKLSQFKALVKATAALKLALKEDPNANPHDIIDYDTFHKEVISLFGADIIPQDVKDFYRKISSNPEGQVDWIEIFGYFHSEQICSCAEVDHKNLVFVLPKKEKIQIVPGGKKHRDKIQCIRVLPMMDLILTATTKGTLVLYNSQVEQHEYIHLRETAWITGCDFLPQIKRILAITERSIIIWDYKCESKTQSHYVTIRPVKHCLLCVSVVHSASETAMKDDILIGDDGGFVNLFTILGEDLNGEDPDLLKKTRSDVLDAAKFKRIRRRLHYGWVLKIGFYPEINCFISCSVDSGHSLICDKLKRLKDNLPVKHISLPHGINTFAYSVKANIIATGGCDRVVRLWHPKIFTKPLGELVGHMFSIVEITINEIDQHIISLSNSRCFRVWDINKLRLLQVFEDNAGGPVEQRMYSMVFDNKHSRLFSGSKTLDMWPLARVVQETKQVPHSHDLPINVLLYNKPLHQVLSICSESIVKVWELETGNQIYEITDAHGPTVELTAAAIHGKGFYFTTGAFNGTLKIWDFGNGQELKVFMPKEEQSYGGEDWLCQMFYLKAKEHHHLVLALDRSGTITFYQGKGNNRKMTILKELPIAVCDSPRNSIVKQTSTETSLEKLSRFGSEEFILPLTGSKEELCPFTGRKVTCFDVFRDNGVCWLATGSIDGLLAYWDLNTSTVLHIFRSCLSECDRKRPKINAVMFMFRKAFSRKDHVFFGENNVDDENKSQGEDENVHKPSGEENPNEEAGVELRTVFSDTEGLQVLASAHEDGHLCLWSSKGKLIKRVLPFVNRPETALTALCTDTKGKVIVAGSKAGYIIIWNVGLFERGLREESKLMRQQIFWLAHSDKVTSLFYEEKKRLIVSASSDGSIRLWFSSNGHYIGFFGQHRTFKLSGPREFVMPCDITELPQKTKDENALDEKKTYEYPLIFDEEKMNRLTRPDDIGFEEVKFFESLSSPKFRRRPEENYEYAAKASSGIYSSIPLYTVQNLKSALPPPPRKMSSQASAFYRDLQAVVGPLASEKKSILPHRKNLQVAQHTTQTNPLVLPPITVNFRT